MSEEPGPGPDPSHSETIKGSRERSLSSDDDGILGLSSIPRPTIRPESFSKAFDSGYTTPMRTPSTPRMRKGFHRSGMAESQQRVSLGGLGPPRRGGPCSEEVLPISPIDAVSMRTLSAADTATTPSLRQSSAGRLSEHLICSDAPPNRHPPTPSSVDYVRSMEDGAAPTGDTKAKHAMHHDASRQRVNVLTVSQSAGPTERGVGLVNKRDALSRTLNEAIQDVAARAQRAGKVIKRGVTHAAKRFMASASEASSLDGDDGKKEHVSNASSVGPRSPDRTPIAVPAAEQAMRLAQQAHGSVERLNHKYKVEDRARVALSKAVAKVKEIDDAHHVRQQAAALAKKAHKGVRGLVKRGKELAKKHELKQRARAIHAGVSAGARQVSAQLAEIDQRYGIRDKMAAGWKEVSEKTTNTAKEMKNLIASALDPEADSKQSAANIEMLGTKVNDWSNQVVRRVRQAQGVRRLLVSRVDNIKRKIKDVLSTEIREGVVEAFEVAKQGEGGALHDLELSTAIPATLAPFMLSMLRSSYTFSIYVTVLEGLVTFVFLLIDRNNTCKYDVETYFAVRLAVNMSMLLCLVLLQRRLDRWYARNGNSWEADVNAAKEMLAEDDLDTNMAISTISTGLATLMFYDKLRRKWASLVLHNAIVPFFLFYNWLVLYLAFNWGCADCEKDLLQVWMVLMACMYLVTLVAQIFMAVSWIMQLCANCLWCKPCMFRCAKYWDQDLPHPITKWLISYLLFRPSSYTVFRRKRRKEFRDTKELLRRKRDLERKLARVNSKLIGKGGADASQTRLRVKSVGKRAAKTFDEALHAGREVYLAAMSPPVSRPSPDEKGALFVEDDGDLSRPFASPSTRDSKKTRHNLSDSSRALRDMSGRTEGVSSRVNMSHFATENGRRLEPLLETPGEDSLPRNDESSTAAVRTPSQRVLPHAAPDSSSASDGTGVSPRNAPTLDDAAIAGTTDDALVAV